MDRKKQISEAVAEFIYEEGFKNFSVGKVSKKLNISKGVFTYHFPTIDILLTYMVNKYFEDASDYMEKHICVDKGASCALESYIESCLYYAAKEKHQTVCIVDVMLNSRSENGEALFKKDDESVYNTLIEIFRYGQEEEKTFRNFSLNIMAKSVRSVIDAMSLAIAKDEISDINKAVGEVKTIFQLATQIKSEV